MSNDDDRRLHRGLGWLAVAVLVGVGWLVGERWISPAAGPKGKATAFEQEHETTLRDLVGEPALPASGSVPLEHAPQDRAAEPASAAPRRLTREEAAEPVPLEQQPFLRFQGTLRSQTGNYRQRMTLEVVHPHGGIGEHDLRFLERRGELVAEFDLIKGELGRYTLRPVLNDPFPLEIVPPELRLDGSHQGLQFLVLDDIERYDVEVVLLDERGGGLKRGRFAWICRGAAEERLLPEPIGPEHPGPRDVPVTAELRWVAGAPGYVPMCGSQRDFTTQPGSRLRRLELRLRPGWGMVLHVRGFGQRRPQAGLAVRVDGVVAATTDADGLALIVAPTAPLSVEVELEPTTWRLEGRMLTEMIREL